MTEDREAITLQTKVPELHDERSRELLERACRVVPGGVNTGRRNIDPPVCIKRAQGSKLVDLDGNVLIDYHAAWGAILLGHAHAEVNRRVAHDIDELVLIGFGTTEREVELAEAIVRHVPSAEQVLLTNSGTEATFHAVRLARAVTGREHVLKFQGLYHGFHDYLLSGSAESGLANGESSRDRRSAGVLAAAQERTLACRYNDLESVEAAFRKHPGQIAAVVIEPYAHNAGSIEPLPGFLQGLREICDREGTLLVFDEVITGFRHALGGYQSIAEVTPDLTTIGKAIANGFPIAAIAGKKQFMQRFSTAKDGDVFVGGTFAGNTAGTSAALATIEILERGGVYEHTYRLGERMRAGLRRIAAQRGIAATVVGYGSLYVMLFMEGPLHNYEDFLRNDAELFVTYRRELLRRGVFEMPDFIGCRSHISAAHTDEDVDLTLTAAEEALDAALDGVAGKGIGAGRL
ncbi:MAG TPA: glutamate-1-semialdehyde 2,1-aminomutase [Solirubrobacteraceae bacterium]|nr:glutamate-1-semialdehyde 2,1-aminomutase [Solirubrobacteraceae bacterium]